MPDLLSLKMAFDFVNYIMGCWANGFVDDNDAAGFGVLVLRRGHTLKYFAGLIL